MTTENNIAKGLLHQDAGISDAPHAPDIRRIVRSEKRRMRLWTATTAGLWIITTAYFIGLWLCYMVFVHPALHELLSQEEVDAALLVNVKAVLLIGLKALVVWPLLLLVSAACTTWLVLTSRRSTLRQMHANLAQISEQLRVLVEKT
jgi:hypothetical protein